MEINTDRAPRIFYYNREKMVITQCDDGLWRGDTSLEGYSFDFGVPNLHFSEQGYRFPSQAYLAHVFSLYAP